MTNIKEIFFIPPFNNAKNMIKRLFFYLVLISFLACTEAPEKTTAIPPAEMADSLTETTEEPTDSGGSQDDPAFADEERIEIDKQGSVLVWEQKVAANSSKHFVFAAKAGQLLLLGFTDDTNMGSMDFGKASVEPNGDGIEYTIEVTKDYRFTVTNNSSASTSFRIYLTVDNPVTATPEKKTAANTGANQIERVLLPKVKVL
jgi:hypothetical protein